MEEKKLLISFADKNSRRLTLALLLGLSCFYAWLSLYEAEGDEFWMLIALLILLPGAIVSVVRDRNFIEVELVSTAVAVLVLVVGWLRTEVTLLLYYIGVIVVFYALWIRRCFKVSSLGDQ